jgi:hypothetical protein
MRKIAMGALALLLAARALAMPSGDRITLPSGRRIFVAGFNLAWINYAGDVGDAPLNESLFRRAFKSVAGAGGNAMRVWLSTNGSRDPKFGPDGFVSGLGSKTIDNVRKMLEIARENGLLLIPVLITHNYMQANQGADLARNRKMLTTKEGLDAYIDKALVPLVKAIGNDPNLLCWEIANEPEGMADRGGWTSQRIAQSDIMRFTNRMAGAIKRAAPGVLVSTGAVTAEKLSWYDDESLVDSGGDPDGTLDFYMFHYYGWNGPRNSPFAWAASDWEADKPVVVGEFPSASWTKETPSSNRMQDSGNVEELLPLLFEGGYAGGLFWQFQRDGGDPWMKGFSSAGKALKDFCEAHRAETRIAGE